MNDFLQALRTQRTERQRVVMTRRNYDEAFNTRMPEPVDEAGLQKLQQAVEVLSSGLGVLTENQRYLIDAQERIADSLERQASAIERILSHLNIG